MNTDEITIEEIKMVIKSLKNNERTGLDEITSKILKPGCGERSGNIV